MPMTPEGKLPIRPAGSYQCVYTCRGRPRCLRSPREAELAQHYEDCTICERRFEYVENG